MNDEKVTQGKDALVGLQWTQLDIIDFAKKLCDNDIRKQIKEGLMIDLSQIKVDVEGIIDVVSRLNVVDVVEEFVE